MSGKRQDERDLKEARLSKPMQRWLEAQGYTVYCEVPYPVGMASLVDMVGEKGDEQIAVALKTSLTKKVIRQAYHLQLCTPRAYCGVGTKPRKSGIKRCEKAGIGILSVVDGEVIIVLEPRDTHARWGKYRFDLSRQEPGGVGGLPNLRGVGPARDVERRIAEYRKTHPDATWKELYANVPNHYASHRSLAQSMAAIPERERMREVYRKYRRKQAALKAKLRAERLQERSE